MTNAVYFAWVYGRSEKLHKQTPNQILNDLSLAIEEGKEWPISPGELMTVTMKPDFPVIMANAIRVKVINYCTEKTITLSLTGSNGRGEVVPMEVLSYFYYTVIGKDGADARSRYRKATLDAAVDGFCGKDQNWHSQWKDYHTSSLKTFINNFGPKLSRWPSTMKRAYKKDFDSHQNSTKTGN